MVQGNLVCSLHRGVAVSRVKHVASQDTWESTGGRKTRDPLENGMRIADVMASV